MELIVKILLIQQVTHDVRRFRVEKPVGYTFKPGQATEVSINKPAWRQEKRPFTFTSLQGDPFLEFTIKRYPDHHGVTDQLHQLGAGDELVLRDVWGAIEYKGPGIFIAGGAGITPFLAILRQLSVEGKLDGNTLFFSNKTPADTIDQKELKTMLGDRVEFIFTGGSGEGYTKGYIDEAFLKQRVKDFGTHFYICGPDPMIAGLSAILKGLGASPDAVVFEK
ncbi:MAG: flavodoxin reductase [Puia sp.]|nr:flavodoxin reductase [Puia sp.]